MFKRVLIANRGEIAVRIARAAAGLGVETVAVYAPADALGLHVKAATTAYPLGGADPVAAYLDVANLVAAAVASGCDAVHPGYGFLSESAAFARACAEASLTFIGPGPEALALFGDKTRARDLARSLGLPIVPGSTPLRVGRRGRTRRQDPGLSSDAEGVAAGGGEDAASRRGDRPR